MIYATEVASKGWVTEMEHAGFKASLKKAQRLQDNGRAHSLPLGSSVPVFPIASLPGCPGSWVRAAGTYVCPVAPDWGLWFDWTMNDKMNTAVVPSVKGMNPITGLAVDSPRLERYADKCPVHDIPFSHGRLCEECGYKWPAQNYVCAPNTLWWDGFRQPDGKVRQFFFSEDEVRDVASAIIGKDNTVPAFGFVFYKPNNPRTPPPAPVHRKKKYFRNGGPLIGSSGMMNKVYIKTRSNSGDASWKLQSASENVSYSSQSLDRSASTDSFSFHDKSGKKDPMGVSSEVGSRSILFSAPVKEVAVGAGAEIRQNLEVDNLGLDGWQSQHSSIVRLYFCFETQFRQIVENGGVKGIEGNSEGFLKNIPVG